LHVCACDTCVTGVCAHTWRAHAHAHFCTALRALAVAWLSAT
jgi:hypothetical protein